MDSVHSCCFAVQNACFDGIGHHGSSSESVGRVLHEHSCRNNLRLRTKLALEADTKAAFRLVAAIDKSTLGLRYCHMDALG